MKIRNLLNTACYAPEDGAGGAPPPPPPPNDPPPPPPSGTGTSAPPWGTDPNAVWTIGDKPWYDHLPEGPTRALFQEKKYANPQVSADAYYSANRMINGNAIELPPTDAPPEAWKSVYQKLGAVDSPDKVTIKYGEGVQVDPEADSWFKQTVAEDSIPLPLAQKLADKWNAFAAKQQEKMVAQTNEQAAQQNATELAEVQKAWGEQFDANVNNGKRVTQALFDMTKPEDKARFAKIEGAIGSAAMLDLFARLGAKTGEGSFDGGNTGGANGDPARLTPEAAAAEINRLQGDDGFQAQYTQADHPQHEAAVRRMNALYAKAGAAALRT
jgi:hypothetical protein